MSELGAQIDDLYGEKELHIEEQDIRILKALVSDDKVARELSAICSYDLFVGDARAFAESALGYFKTYNQLPTKRIMLDQAKTDNCFEQIWNEIDRVEYNYSEFGYDLEKIKDRFTKKQILKLKDKLDESLDTEQLEGVLKDVRANIDYTEKIRRGKEQVYIQKTLKSYMPEFREEFIQKSKNPSLGKGILTGYSYLDYITNGLSASDMLIISAETGGGKAQPLDTLIPTPDGFKLLKDVKPGDVVFGRDGKPCNVVAESDIIIASGWKFIFNDNSEVISHDNHEWLTFDRKEQQALCKRNDAYRLKERKKYNTHKPWLWGKNTKPAPIGTIHTSSEIVNSLKSGLRNNHAIPLARPLELPVKNLIIDPYILGLWLGDGATLDGRITTADIECVDAFISSGYQQSKIYSKDGGKAKTYSFLKLRTDLREIGVFNNKHVPDDYLWASKEQRLALLQGLMDSDGFVSSTGQIDFVNTNERIANAVAFLVRSLGRKCTISKGNAVLYGRITGPKWTVRFSPNFPAFRLRRKLDRQNNKNLRLNNFRYIKEAVRTNPVPMKCIQVDSTDHLYLTGENFVPTHNSMLLANMAKQMWMQENTIEQRGDFKKGYNILYFSLEMPYDQCARRTISSMSDVATYALRDCQITDSVQLARLADAANFTKCYPYEFEIVDVPRGVTVEQIEERYLEAIGKGNSPEIVVVDYLGLMDSQDEEGDDWLRLGKIAGRLHEFARAYNIVMLTAVQLNRSTAKDPADAIGLHRIGRSSQIMHHATIGLQILTRKNEDTFSDLEYYIIKNRNGERGKHNLKKKFQTATLVDIDSYIPINDFGVVNVNINADDISDKLAKLGW
jgi:replicative DNA helicase